MPGLHSGQTRHVFAAHSTKQSHYDLMEAGGLSYHRSEKDNPKWDEAQILARREEIKKLAPRWAEVERGELLILLEDEGHLVWGDPS